MISELKKHECTQISPGLHDLQGGQAEGRIIPRSHKFKQFVGVHLFYYICYLSMSRHSSRKKLRDHSPSFSPSNAYGSYYKTWEDDPETKLSEKIHKLKFALKAAQQHNEQLHNKIKYYKELYSHDVTQFKEELKKYKKKYSSLQHLYDKKAQQYQQVKSKNDYDEREAISSARDQLNRIKDMEARIIDLEATNLDLSTKLNEKTQKIKSLQAQLSRNQQERQEQMAVKIAKLQKDLMTKNKQCLEHTSQMLGFKDLLKQANKKLQKTNLTVYEQAERIKRTLEECKEERKNASLYQKQLATLREAWEKQKAELKQKSAAVEKSLIENQFEKQRLAEKLGEETKKNQKLHSDLEQVYSSYNRLLTTHDQLVSFQYEMQRDFERELNAMAKEIARRHLASKSPKTSTSPSLHSGNLRKREFPHFLTG